MSDHPQGRDPVGVGLRFRRYRNLWVAVDFDTETIRLQRIEAARPGTGNFRRLLHDLKWLSDTFQVPLKGNAFAYPTAQTSNPDQDRLNRTYRALGFRVGPPPWHELTYPPATGDAG